ncbi:hypothetical protein NA56DRAFT_586389, partial [Hyaloscypha hepaticicola]
NPKQEERDFLVIEIHLRNYKGIDNKPKFIIFLFRENPLSILYPISYILTRIICNNIILINNYISPESFFIIDLENQNIKVIKVY